jgi:hypothetical protein
MYAMGHRTTHRPGRRPAGPKRPSVFFMIALGIGVILLVWLFAVAVRQPVKPKPASTQTTIRTSSSLSA